MLRKAEDSGVQDQSHTMYVKNVLILLHIDEMNSFSFIPLSYLGSNISLYCLFAFSKPFSCYKIFVELKYSLENLSKAAII